MTDWYTQILPLVLGPPIVIGAFVLWKLLRCGMPFHAIPWFYGIRVQCMGSRRYFSISRPVYAVQPKFVEFNPYHI